MTTLTKHQIVMYRNALITGDTHAVFEGDDEEAICVEIHRWIDMGAPDEITVTVEPGDRLNADT